MQQPFEYNFIEQNEYISFYSQRNAKYKEVAKQDYKIDSKQSFLNENEPPTPQIMEIDGYDAETSD